MQVTMGNRQRVILHPSWKSS